MLIYYLLLIIIPNKLPHTHWTEYTADDTGLVYYNNDTTGESVWEKPEVVLVLVVVTFIYC